MTKDDIRLKVNSFIKQGGINYPFHEIKSAFDEFFDSNVCIPKGQQRHKYADILHEWIEGAEMQWKTDYGVWKNVEIYSQHCELRIKPSEPIYEWQWLAQDINTKKVFITLHTKNENPEFINSVPLYRIEETKRIIQ